MNYTQSRKTTADVTKSCDYADYTMYDGYTWAEVQARQGLTAMPEVGEWPYNIYVRGVNSESGNYIIKEFTEHDVKTWIYTDTPDGKEQYTHHLKQLREYGEA